MGLTGDKRNVIAMRSNNEKPLARPRAEAKRQMLGYVFSTVALEDPTLRYSLVKSFGPRQQMLRNPEWRAGQDKSGQWEVKINHLLL